MISDEQESIQISEQHGRVIGNILKQITRKFDETAVDGTSPLLHKIGTYTSDDFSQSRRFNSAHYGDDKAFTVRPIEMASLDN